MMLPSRKGPRKGGGVQSVWVPSAGILCGCPSATKSKLAQARFFLLNSFGNEVVEFVTFRDCFCHVGSPLDERISEASRWPPASASTRIRRSCATRLCYYGESELKLMLEATETLPKS